MPRFEEDRNKIKIVSYVAGKKGLFYPVIGLGVVELGEEVCAFGSFNGYLCGKLVETGSSLEISQENANYTFAGMNKVDLGEGHGFDSERDLGGPVYVTSNIGERTIAQALVNNFSQPLSETELEIGKNFSEIVKRGDKLILYGGMKITAVSVDKGKSNQRDCTLSFPVYRVDDRELGFLTSYACAEDNIIVGTTEVDTISRNISYSRCVKSGRGIVDVDEPLPIIPFPSQPLAVGDKVYAHGGVSGTVHGVILKISVKIQTKTNPP
ncbi:11096_t:CDS:2, partial [Paraglomus occultum]